MSRNGNGTYNLPAGNPVVTGTTISSTWANNTLADMANAITGSIAADGQTPITGALKGTNGTVSFAGVGQTKIPSGTTAQRAASPVNGMIRYNTDINKYEGYSNGAWEIIGNGAGGVLYEDTQTATQGQTLFISSTGYLIGANNLSVYVNGSRQIVNVNYTETSSTSFTFTTGLNAGDLVNFAIGASSALEVNADAVLYNEGGTGAVNRTAQVKFQESISVKDFGAICDGSADDSVALFNANAEAITANCALFINGPMYIGTSTTITVPLVDTLNQYFTSTSNVTIDNNLPVRPDWWGQGQNTLNYATNALPSTGGVVKLANKTYLPNNHVYGTTPANAVCFNKNNVSYIGEKMPQLSLDCKQLVSGSIIQGTVIAWANNIEFSNLGVDSGYTVQNTYFSGADADALTLTYSNQQDKVAGTFKRGARLNNVAGLCRAPASSSHAVIMNEGYSEVVATGEVLGCYGVHGVVIKGGSLRADQLTSYCNSSEGVVFKSDNTSSNIVHDVQVNKIFVAMYGPTNYSPYATTQGQFGVMLNPAANAITKLQIGEIQTTGCRYGLGFYGSNYATLGVQIGSIITDGSTTVGLPNCGMYIQGNSGVLIDLFQVGNAVFENHQQAIYSNYNTTGVIQFGSTSIYTTTDVGVEIQGTSNLSFDSLKAAGTTQGIFRISGTPRLLVNQIWNATAGAATFTNYGVPVLQAGTVSVNTSSATVTGTGTSFNDSWVYTQLYDASLNYIGTVVAVANSTSLTLGTNSAITYSGAFNGNFIGNISFNGSGWSQVGGGEPFAVSLSGGQIALKGRIQPAGGSTNYVCSVPVWAAPTSTMYGVALGQSTGGTQSSVPVRITTDGQVIINETVGGFANCGTFLSLNGVSWTWQG